VVSVIKLQCEAVIRTYQPFRLGLGDGCHESKQCAAPADVVVVVKGQGKMNLCHSCLPHFKNYATLPFTVRSL
jgi:hypothetical protein